MEKKIKILHLEDLPTDAELVAREIKKGGLKVYLRWVDNEKDFRQALSEFTPDIILSDHSLPSFNSLGALKIVHELKITVPFILITSTTSEEIAVSVMRAGAWDYILKDRMGRLPMAVLGAFEKWQNRNEKEKYLEQIIRNEKKFRGMIENSYDIVNLVTKDFESLYRSPSTERITGWTDEDWKQGGGIEMTHPEDIENFKKVVKQTFAHPGTSLPVSFRTRHKNGNYLWIEGVITNMLHDEAINGIITNFHDVTETKLAQLELAESLRQLKFHLDNSPLGFIECDHQFSVKKMSERAEEIFGWTTKEYQELQRAGHIAVHPEDYELAGQMATELVTGKVSRNHLQKRIINKSGKVIWTEWFNSVLKNNSGEIITIMSLVADITDKKETEIKIRESEANLLSILENSDVIIYSLNRNFEYITFNSALKDSLKAAYNLDTAVGDNAFGFLQKIAPAEAAEWEAVYSKALSGEHLQFEKEFAIGNFYRISSFSINPIIADEKVIGLSCFVHDITDQKLAQKKILANEKRFRSMIENISDGIVLTDNDQKLLYQSPSVAKILGYSEAEWFNRSIVKYVHPDYLQQFYEVHKAAKKDSSPHHFELPFLHKNGKYIWLEGVATNLLNEPSVRGIVTNYRDVTQRKMLNDILKEYNDRIEIVSKATNDAIWDWNIEEDHEVWNHGMETLFGYPIREMHEIKNWQKSKIHPGDYERIQQEIETAFTEKAETWASRYQYLCSNGNYKHVLDRAYILYDGDKPLRMIGAMQDITEQVISEQMILSLNERYEIVLDTTGDAVWDWDLIDDTIVWGNGLSRLFGYQANGNMSIAFWNEKIHKDDLNRILEFIYKTMADPKKNRWQDEYRFRKSDGSYAFVQDRGTIIRDKNGKALRMVGSMQDITERIRSIEEIKKLSLVASKISNAVIIADQNAIIVWVNESFTRLCGYQLDEVRGRTSSFLQGPETDRTTIERISERIKKHEVVSEEIVNYSKSGNKYWSKLDITPLFNEHNELTNFISVQTDITELKQFEQSITSIARELSGLIEYANVPIFGADRNGYINEWNKAATSLSGYSKNEVLGKKWFDFLDEKLHAKVQVVLDSALDGNSVNNFELPFVSKMGNQLTLLISISTRMDVNKKVMGVLCVGQDLTELIQYRQGLEKLVAERTQELNEALNKEKELVEMKSKFVSIASHEFRTPLSTISLVSGFLSKHREKINPDEFNLKLASIDKQVNHMTYLLDDILMIGKSEAGKIQPVIKPVAIVQFIQQLCEEVEQNSKTHTINIQENCSVKEINADEKLLRNIVINLLTNAIKFSPQANAVFVRISNSKEYLKLEVEDQGIGIAKEDIVTVFTAFNRGSNVGTIQGTGLGLSIVKKAVELLKGTITFTSEVNHGTSFTITLPLRST